jgi:hypothetical protein
MLPLAMLWLTDEQLAAVTQATRPLQPHARATFLEELAAALRDHSEIGDGLLFRTLRQLQHKHFDAPILGGPGQHGPRHAID